MTMKNRLSGLRRDLQRLGAKGLDEKLSEYSHAGAALENLTAELRMGLAISLATGLSIQFQSGEASDLRLQGEQLDCTIEVEHKSSASAFSGVFHPTQENLAEYASATKAWQVAAWRLHAAVMASAFEIHPWIDAKLSEPHWSWQERAEQEDACAVVANWLAEELQRVRVGHKAQLTHASARFDLIPLDGPPGRISGHGPLNAFWLRANPTEGDSRLSLSEWFGNSIQRKSAIAAKYPERRGAVHLIGLVVDEAFACSGDVLASTLFGGLISYSGPSERCKIYRGVPESGRHLVMTARARGREDLLNRMQFDCDEPVRGGNGLVFDEKVREHADGVLGLYCTDELQFLPNPFTTNAIEPLCSLFPDTVKPRLPGALRDD
jgi:hypothetical protein